MDYKYLEVREIQTAVVQVTINRPEVHNAFNSAVMEEFEHCFNALGVRQDIRLVILRGRGVSFSAGADLDSMKSLKESGEDQNKVESLKLSAMFAAIDNLPVPLMGVVQGAALGGGTGLVSVCDYVIAGPRARFGFTEARLGILPAVISSYAVSKIGFSWARALFLSGKRIGPELALQIGLVHCYEPDEESLEKRVGEMIGEFLACGPSAVRLSKQLLKKLPDYVDPQELREYTSQLIAGARVSPEGQEGMAAFLEKRRPAWVVDDESD